MVYPFTQSDIIVLILVRYDFCEIIHECLAYCVCLFKVLLFVLCLFVCIFLFFFVFFIVDIDLYIKILQIQYLQNVKPTNLQNISGITN